MSRGKTPHLAELVGKTTFDILIIAALYVVAQMVAAIVTSPFDTLKGDTAQATSTSIGYVVAGVVMAGGIYMYMRQRSVSFSSLQVRMPSLSTVGYAVAGFFAYILLTIVATVVMKILFSGFRVNEEQDLGLGDVSGAVLPLTFVALVVVPPLVEEFLFRGFLYSRMKAFKVPKIVAGLTVSLLFGLVHGQWNVAVDTFVLSTVMLVVLEQSKNLWSTVIIHAMKNSLAFFVLFVFPHLKG